MPLAAVGAGLGGLGALSSGISGKKASSGANKLAQQQLGLQQSQFGLQKQQVGLGNQAIGGANNYWNALLSGNRGAAAEATGPYASMIGQQGQGAAQAIQSQTARGGEQNLALAQNAVNTGNNVSRLYAGMQPLAAQNLAQNAGILMGSGAQFNPNTSPYTAASVYQSQMANQQQAGQGFGNLLYSSLNKMNQGGGGKNALPSDPMAGMA